MPAIAYSNFIEETCTGTGATITFSGATTNNNAFGDAFADGELCYYAILDEGSSPVKKVYGLGTYNLAGNTLTRNDLWNADGATIDPEPTTNITLSGTSMTIRCDAGDKNIISHFQDGVQSTRYFVAHNMQPNQANAEPGGEFTAAADRMGVVTGRFYNPVLITSIGFDITTSSAGGNMRCGIYQPTEDGSNGTLIVDSGNISTASTGLVFAALSTPIILPPGAYYLADVADNTVVRARGVRTNGDGQFFGGIQGAASAGEAELKNYYNITFGALPTTFPTVTSTNNLASPTMIFQ